ncbi:hypothetical protein BLNAU_613 [Blattamonas nauphoetae]|uniref:Uncharacterized protein n=1 Tax=Blattamonas nauphoetae TaxID=2049346 RepID=A0ABQ9YLQ8_9EUKA|nr:hypothetical protein BLNAU_613 [Blattamonas nauphoetae]
MVIAENGKYITNLTSNNGIGTILRMIRQYQDRITPTPILLLTECLHLEQDLFDIFLENDAIVVLQPLLTRLEEPVVCQTIRFYSEVSTLHNYPLHVLIQSDVMTLMYSIAENLSLSDRVLEEIVLLIVNITCASDDQIEAFLGKGELSLVSGHERCASISILCRGLYLRSASSVLLCLDGIENLLYFGSRKVPCLPAPLSAAEQSVPSHNFQSFISSGKSSINVFPQFVIQAGGQDRIFELNQTALHFSQSAGCSEADKNTTLNILQRSEHILRMFFDESSLTDFDSGLVHPDSFKNVAFPDGSSPFTTCDDYLRHKQNLSDGRHDHQSWNSDFSSGDTGQPEERNSEDGYWKKDFFPQRQHTLKDDWG